MRGIIILLSVLVCSQTIFAKEYIVKFSDSKTFRSLQNNKNIKRTIPQLGLIITEQPDQFAQFSDSIQYVEENSEIRLPKMQVSKSSLNRLWGLKAIHIQEAWKKTQGEDIVVAVSDTGVWRPHGDLKNSMWTNSGETGLDSQGHDKSKNKVDDDQNGFVDDTWGWNFSANNNNPIDDHYHGTHVAGIIAADDDNNGIVGVAPKAKIMSLKFLDAVGSGTVEGGALTILYAADNGANIVNCSWGGVGQSPTVAEAIAYAQSKNVLVIAASGNDGVNTDGKPHTPSTENVDNIISVGATSSAKGTKSGFSNYGPLTVDLAAPGTNIYSSVNPINLRKFYEELSGTSMAAPHVAGVAALVWSLNPHATWKQIKDKLVNSATRVPYWNGKSQSGGVLNAEAAVE